MKYIAVILVSEDELATCHVLIYTIKSLFTLLTYFAHSNPNEAQESDPIRAGRQERVRMKNIEWTAYEAVHKKYLNIDTKSKLKNHYRAHR